MILRFLRAVTYGFLDVAFGLIKLAQRQEEIPEVGVGMLGGDIIVSVPDQDVFVYLDGLIVVA